MSGRRCIRRALFDRRTVVYWKDTLIGRPEHLVALLEASIVVDAMDATPRGIRVLLGNRSDAQMTLRNETGLHSGSHSGLIVLPAHGETEVTFSVDEPAASDLVFSVLNALVAPNQPAELTLRPK